MSDRVKEALGARDVKFTELPNGDIFFRRGDGQGMYVRHYSDGTYNWSANAQSDTNLMDFSRPERHGFSDVLRRVDDFLGLVVSGRVIIDTLGMVQQSMARGMSRKNAERIATIARNFALEMHDAGMDADEIKTRFEEIHEQLRRERLNDLPRPDVEAHI